MYKQPYIHIEPQFAEVHFERPMSRIQLEQLRNDLAAIQIQINYTDIKYDGELLNFWHLLWIIKDNRQREVHILCIRLDLMGL